MDEVVENLVPFDICGLVILEILYLYVRDVIFRRRYKQYRLIKYGNTYDINAHRDKHELSLISSHHAWSIIGNKRNIFLLFFKEENQ